jgi:hypothetical protein
MVKRAACCRSARPHGHTGAHRRSAAGTGRLRVARSRRCCCWPHPPVTSGRSAAERLGVSRAASARRDRGEFRQERAQATCEPPPGACEKAGWMATSFLHPAHVSTEQGGRALAGENGPGWGPRKRRRLHALVRWHAGGASADEQTGAWRSVMSNDGTAPPAAQPVPALLAARAGSRRAFPSGRDVRSRSFTRWPSGRPTAVPYARTAAPVRTAVPQRARAGLASPDALDAAAGLALPLLLGEVPPNVWASAAPRLRVLNGLSDDANETRQRASRRRVPVKRGRE